MKTRFFFLAAASSMFLSYHMVQNQWASRVPANFPVNTNAISSQQFNDHRMAPPLNSHQLTYSYTDIVNIYDVAVRAESQMRSNQLQMEGMLAQERLRSQQQNYRTRANPYNTAQRNVQTLQFEIRKLKQLRQNNLETAYIRLYSTYTSLQNASASNRQTLSEAHNADARLRLENLMALKQSVELEGTGYYNYPQYQQTYLTAAAYTPPLIHQPLTPFDAHVLDYQQQLAAQKQIADQPAQQLPQPSITVQPESNAIDPVVSDQTETAETIPEDPTAVQ